VALLRGRVTGWLARHQQRVKTIGTGLFLYLSFNAAYDYGFYSFAIFHWGIVFGGGLASFGSLVQNAIMFWLYDRMGIDWLGAHALEQLEAKENKTRLERYALWVRKEKKSLSEKMWGIVLFALITISIDPLIVAVHFKPRQFDGLSVRDWGILLAAVTLGVTWWLARAGGAVEAFMFIKGLVF
jgi:hypothetical protein